MADNTSDRPLIPVEDTFNVEKGQYRPDDTYIFSEDNALVSQLLSNDYHVKTLITESNTFIKGGIKYKYRLYVNEAGELIFSYDEVINGAQPKSGFMLTDSGVVVKGGVELYDGTVKELLIAPESDG